MSENFEKILFKVLRDLEKSLPYLVLVGGWVPYCYSHYEWQLKEISVQLTTDIDFGIIPSKSKKNINQITAQLKGKEEYKEKHLTLGKMQPYVLQYRSGDADSPVPIEFLSSLKASKKSLTQITGQGPSVNQLKYFDFLLENTQKISISKKGLEFIVPTEVAYSFHKGLTFSERLNQDKKAKDILSLYYMLVFSPNRKKIVQEINGFKKHTYWRQFEKNIYKYFQSKQSSGIRMLKEGLKMTDWPNLEDGLYVDMFMGLVGY